MRLLTLLGTFLLCFQLANAQSFSLQGRIIDKANSVPLIGASVFIVDANLKTQTGTDGKYSIENLSKGTYKLIISFIGYESVHDTIHLQRNGLSKDYALSLKDATMQEIVVTGTGTEHYLKDAPVQTEVITGKALREYSGRSIEDVLGGLSSSLTFQEADMGSNIKLNGLTNDYILILLDGRRINGDVGGQNDLNKINMSNIERIEIVKGAVSSLYGSDAIGGVINFISKKEKDKLSIQNTTRVGEYGDVNQNNSINWNHKGFSSSTLFSLKHTDGWRNTTQEWHRARLTENSVTRTINRSTNYTITENITYKVSKQLELNADASFYEKWTDRPMGNPLWRPNGFYYRNQTYGSGAKYSLPNKNIITMDVSFDRYDYHYDYIGREYTDYYDESGDRIVYYPGDRILQSSQRRLLTNLKGIFHLGKQHKLNTGVEYVWDKLVSPYRLDGDKAITYSLSAYAQDEWNVTEQLNITVGIRYGHSKDFDNIFTPKVSAMYKLGNFNLRATYSNGYKAPTVKELYYHYYATLMSKFKAYYGDTNLKPQKSNYFAANAEFIIPKFKVSITAYHNRMKDMISLQHTETSYEDKLLLVEETMKYVNLAKARTYGVDLTFEVQLPCSIRLAGGYSYLDAKAQRTDDDEAADFMQYVYINGTSRHNATFKVSWSNSWKRYQLGLNLNGRYQSKKYFTSDGDADGFQIWRLNTSHSLLDKKKIKLNMNVGIDNIFDYVDRTPFGHNRGTTSPGRNYYASVTIKFQNTNK
ncbi:TonB-dependent receptor [Dysgonomonas sp. Marseille-P4677]|uniref:TonB-dependent receptor n=1 Tax=Dysgonomonas sp. Marseille-P4677 TaxID=2364790 RepID=UPI001F396D2A|nr:TonB-dependent receptor [Dysgonomonas sp. Marseille-P4677]